MGPLFGKHSPRQQCSPSTTLASDFAIFRSLLNGATILFAFVYGFVAYAIAKQIGRASRCVAQHGEHQWRCA
jgi:hypothetical protein